MKCLILSFAFLGIASASVFDFNRYGLMNKHEVGSTYGQRYTGVYGQYPTWNQFWTKNFWQQKYGKGVFDKQEVYGDKAVFDRDVAYGHQAFYGQNVHEVLTDILFRIFNKQVWLNLFSQYVYQQTWTQNVWDHIMYQPDIFDYDVLEQLIRQPALRDMMVREGIFDKYVLEQVLSYYNVHQTYDHVLFEQLVNKTVLKNWLFKLGFYDKYVLYQFFNRRIYESTFGSMELCQKWLLQVVNNPVLRTFLVQQGVFNEDVLEQVLQIQGFYSEKMIEQLINKAVLRNFFIQHGFVNYNVLEKLLSNEIFGLKVYLKVQFFQHIPEFSFKQFMSQRSYSPEFVFQKFQNFPVGGRFFGYDFSESNFQTIAENIATVLFGSEGYQKLYSHLNGLYGNTERVNYLWNIIFGYQGHELNEFIGQGYNYFYGRPGFYNYKPVVQY
ncbi:hypothetical protein WA026_012105 [Henosepilachna vigintioctopunctata]|uniref:Uncharacterized protein n=1 Tax=Henosepilachna vigintioctopunctata TaxID=420089 RepID=A0AAW1VBB6_9CUCU